MRRWTERQLRIYLAWLELRDHPDYLQYGLQRVACEVARVLSQNPGDIQPQHFATKFEIQAKKPRITMEEAAESSKSRWSMILGTSRTRNNGR